MARKEIGADADPQHRFALPDVFNLQQQSDDVSMLLHDGSYKPERIKITLSTHAVSFILRGRKRLVDGPHCVVLGAGDVLFYTQGAQLVAEDSRDYQSLVVFFSNALLSEFLLTHKIAPIGDAAGRQHMAFTGSDFLRDIGGALAPLVTTHGDMTGPMRKIWCAQILRAIFDTQGAHAFAHLNNHIPISGDTRIAQVLAAHWNEGLTVDELAYLAAMSLSTFRRKVHALYGVSPKVWLETRRMGHAWHMLTVAGQKPSRVASDMRFSSPSSFGHAFRRHFGMAPSEAAKAHS